MNRDVAVIGGGIVGLAAAYKLLQARPGASVVVLEKESAVARHQSGHNSGVLHAGLHYTPGSLKARLAVDGLQQMTAFCRDHTIPFEICGKLVVATSKHQIPELRALMLRGERNGLQGLKWLEPAQIREHEPHAAGVAALRVPGEGIVSYPAVCDALTRAIESLGGTVQTSAGVQAIARRDGGWMLETAHGAVQAGFLVNCAGLQTDRIAALSGERSPVRIVPFRGAYFELRPERAKLVRHLIYPVPDPAFPFLGVHLTRTVDGRVLAGPTAALAWAEGGTRALAFPGLWRFLARHPRHTWREFWQSLGRARITRALQRLVPEIQVRDLVPATAGVRAQAMLPNGDLVNDFAFLARPTALHVLNAPSPAATASLAIADEIVRMCASVREASGACAS